MCVGADPADAQGVRGFCTECVPWVYGEEAEDADYLWVGGYVGAAGVCDAGVAAVVGCVGAPVGEERDGGAECVVHAGGVWGWDEAGGVFWIGGGVYGAGE